MQRDDDDDEIINLDKTTQRRCDKEYNNANSPREHDYKKSH